MNYILEIKAFYDWLEVNQLSTSAIVLWHALMHIANKTGWQDTFTVATVVLSTKTGLKRDALYNARAALQNKGLISFKVRTGNQSAVYIINPFVSVKPTQTPTQLPIQTPTQLPIQTPTINKQNKTKQNDGINPPYPRGESAASCTGEEKQNNSNVERYETALFTHQNYRKKVNEWLRYKKEKRQDYQPTGLRRLLAQIQNECAKYGEQAVIDVIDMAIANNYQGILWEK